MVEYAIVRAISFLEHVNTLFNKIQHIIILIKKFDDHKNNIS